MSDPVRELHLVVALERAIQIAERLNNDMAREYHIGTSMDFHRVANDLADLKIMAKNARKFGVISEIDYMRKQEEEAEQLAEEMDNG